MSDKERKVIAENCQESSFQEGLSWIGAKRIIELGELAQTLAKF